MGTKQNTTATVEDQYGLRGIKTFQGRDGYGLNATLTRNGKAVCTLLDEGCGGMMFFDWHDRRGGASAEEDRFKAFIEIQRAEIPADKKNEYDMNEREMFDGEMWVNQKVDEIQNERRFKRICKTKTLFQVGDEIGSDSFRTIKGVGAQLQSLIQKKYAGQPVFFLNDKYAPKGGVR